MTNILEKVTGEWGEKKRWRDLQKRVKALPDDYRAAYEEIQKYIWTASGVETIDPLVSIVELFEQGAADKRAVLDITGTNVAAFVDELTRGERSYFERRRKKLNESLAKLEKKK